MNTTITVFRTLLSGNLGDGWRDEQEATGVFAAALETALTDYCEDAYPDAIIDVRIDYERASGASRAIEVISDLDAGEEIRLVQTLRDVEERTWEVWGNSEAARELYA